MVEISCAYEDGALRVSGNYSKFLEAKEEYLHAQQKRQQALENRVRIEIAWLRRGPKARTTKSKARIDDAHGMIGELAEMKARTRTPAAEIDFSATSRKTKQLLTLDDVSYGFGERTLIAGLHFIVTQGMRVGLVGPNGGGKTTLLRLLRGDIEPAKGKIRKADGLRIVYFDQSRQLDPEVTLRRAPAPGGDAASYEEREIHVAAWAGRDRGGDHALNRQVGGPASREQGIGGNRGADHRGGAGVANSPQGAGGSRGDGRSRAATKRAGGNGQGAEDCGCVVRALGGAGTG